MNIFTALLDAVFGGIREERLWRRENPGAWAAVLKVKASAMRQRSLNLTKRGRKGLARAAANRAATLDAKAEVWEKKANG